LRIDHPSEADGAVTEMNVISCLQQWISRPDNCEEMTGRELAYDII